MSKRKFVESEQSRQILMLQIILLQLPTIIWSKIMKYLKMALVKHYVPGSQEKGLLC